MMLGMKKTNSHTTHAIAACSFELDANERRVQLMPLGRFKARDGRPLGLAGWRLEADDARRVLAQLATRQTDIVVDYEHQTLYSEKNGKPAPAAGWIKPGSIVLGEQGLYATDVEWTAAASSHIKEREYRYISPVFSYDKQTGAVAQLHHVALTNYPAVDGMDALSDLAAARFDLADLAQHIEEENTVKREQLIALLGLSSDASEEDIQSALTALKTKAGSADALEQQVAALKTTAGQPGQVDPTQFAPVALVTQLQQQIAALTTQQNSGALDQLIAAGLDDGRLLPAMEPWARDVGGKDIAALKSFLDAAQPIAALKGQQTAFVKPAPNQTVKDLSETEMAMCKAFGTDPEAYLKTKMGEL